MHVLKSEYSIVSCSNQTTEAAITTATAGSNESTIKIRSGDVHVWHSLTHVGRPNMQLYLLPGHSLTLEDRTEAAPMFNHRVYLINPRRLLAYPSPNLQE